LITKSKKILLLKIKHTFVLALLFLLLMLSSAKEQFHNHKPNESERDDCPTLIITQSFSSAITIHFELPAFQTIELYLDIPNYSKSLKSKSFIINLRAPPII